jgi:hypothetical protein
MSPAGPQHDANSHLDLLTSGWKRIRAHLEDHQRRVYEEIRNYPRPIPACDQQFNWLLEERARISQELERLQLAYDDGLARGGVEAIVDFVQSSRYMDEGARQGVRSCFQEGLPKPPA